MLLREDGDAVICIGQASHAWLSGQLARAWRDVEPREEVCLAAEQHDVGMAQWDLAPTLNPGTGRPHSFMEMPLATHLALWTAAPQRLFTQSRYAALLVSMHGTALYEMRDLARMGDEDAEAVRAYLAGQRALQERLAAEVGASEDERRRNQRLLWAWDWLSLALLLDWAPATLGDGDLALGEGHTLDPWPFAEAGPVEVRCEGRRLEGRYDTEAGLHAALEAAPRVELRFALKPA
ncbi:MAG: DUF3891 family protein [Actinomycetota bacterium]|nr:DUF3891 family protein [Actinomycetota bacterium]